MNNDALSDGVRKKQTSPFGRRFGLKPELRDGRDRKYSLMHPRLVELPPKVDYIDKFPYVFDQADSSSCTAQSGCYIMGFLKGVKSEEDAYSRLFYYYQERDYENSINEDGGASIRDGIKLLAAKGVCFEKTWTFDLKNNLFKKPSDEAYKEALMHKITSYSRLQTRQDYRQCLAKGYPFTIGISCYSNLDGAQVTNTGLLSMPGESESLTGGHCITIVGYDTDFHNSEIFQKSGLTKEQFPYPDCYHVLNSWGNAWADRGTFWIPAAYIDDQNYSEDGWYISA